MAQLVALASSRTDDEIRILVTHVSPGREPLVWWLAAHLGADYSISGHMGMPYCVVWNEFSVREHETSVVDFTNRRERIEQAWDVAKSTMPAGEHRDLVEQGMALLRRYPVVGSPEKGQRGLPTMVAGRAKGEARAISFRDTFAINLPDADRGHAVLIVEQGRDFVGMDYRFMTPDPDKPHSENLDMRFAARSVEYQVTGLLKYTP